MDLELKTAIFLRGDFSLVHAEIWAREHGATIFRVEYTKTYASLIWRIK